jgi:hypothetical protein
MKGMGDIMEKTLKELINEKGLKMTCTYGAKENADFKNSDGWTVTIYNDKKRYTFAFYMGYGHNGKEPDIENVMDCILSDASSYENARDFEDFANEFGYDTDSRKAEKIYKACGKEAERLKKLLGEDYETFIYAERN